MTTRALDSPSDSDQVQQPGRLQRTLSAGRRVCLVEARPPAGPDLSGLVRAADRLAESADAIQLTDMPFATPHVANLAAGTRLALAGHEVVLNVTCRDRNLIAQQGTVLGAAAVGIKNVFCIRGDVPSAGDHPRSRGVFELSGLELIALARRLRDKGRYASGRSFSPKPRLFIGAAVAPHATYGDGAAELARKKLEAGADFLVTQPLFSRQSLEDFLKPLDSILSDTHLIAGVGPITTLEALRDLKSSSELRVAPELDQALQAGPAKKRAQVGIDRALAIVDDALDLGAHGILVYPFDCGLEQTAEFVQEVRKRLARR